MEVEPHHPLVLDSADEGRLIVIELPGRRGAAGTPRPRARLARRRAEARSRSTTPTARPWAEGPGLVAEFSPNEARTVRATEDARILLLLSPWPGEGHPSRG